MVGWDWQAGGRISIPALALTCLAATLAPLEAAWGMSDKVEAVSYLASFDPGVLWETLIGAVVVCAFAAAVAMWGHSALRRVQRAKLRRNAFISSALNNLSQGVMMTDAQDRVVFCNDRFHEIYGLSHGDVTSEMTGREWIELGRARGHINVTAEELKRLAFRPEGLVVELPSGRSVVIKFFRLPNGGAIGFHEDCTAQRKLSQQLASTKQFLESVLDNV